MMKVDVYYDYDEDVSLPPLTWQDVDVSILFFILFLGSGVARSLDGADRQRLKTKKENTFKRLKCDIIVTKCNI